MPHLNNKQNKNTNPIISRQDYHLTQPCPSEEKQKTHYKAYTNHWTSLRRAETKRKKEFNLEDWERGPQTQYVKKAEKYYTNEGTN